MSAENLSGYLVNIFPISGRDVCNFLKEVLGESELCVIKYFEALGHDEGLGDLWHRVCKSHNEVLTREDLLEVLLNADQIITLDMYVKNDSHRALYIEDGELFEETMSRIADE
ncbi:hypothetical protein [Ralstonia pseudosolanacearum]|uniref:Uncharacterized protein n=1 Tax=Ralstonia solanacearum TaxID=305 RepID=A0AA92ICV1_RALSL|nr:hypothetical protein [Ralstonia pseudosolanacearum]QCX47914.1 hypothetical protein E7Z57_01660 [Ralstonia pseudosolanacearum]